MNVAHAEFVVSNTEVEQCPKSKIPEYAFIGRSNVGKSSLINMLCNRKKLAKTSSRPGKTQLINHYLINKQWHLVDLPGYGYARVSKTRKKTFQKFITNYFVKRKELIAAFLLVDLRHKPQIIDLEFMNWLGENWIPFSIVFTKADKLKEKEIKKNIYEYFKRLEDDWEEIPKHFITSSEKSIGKDELLSYINHINHSIPYF